VQAVCTARCILFENRPCCKQNDAAYVAKPNTHSDWRAARVLFLSLVKSTLKFH
jgi:hypothetical protein